MTIRLSWDRISALGCISLVLSVPACGQYIETPPKLIAPAYRSDSLVTFALSAGQVNISNIRMTTLSGRIAYPPGGTPRIFHEHDFALTFDVTANSVTVPGTATGHMRASTIGGLGTYLTEVGDFDASGSSALGSFIIRQNYSTFSEGLSQVEDHGTFFLVWGWLAIATELSVDGGSTWNPANDHINLNAVPEPATLIGVALGVGALLRRRRKL